MKWELKQYILHLMVHNFQIKKDCIELFEAITDEHIVYLDIIKGNLYFDETHTWYVNVNEKGDEI